MYNEFENSNFDNNYQNSQDSVQNDDTRRMTVTNQPQTREENAVFDQNAFENHNVSNDRLDGGQPAAGEPNTETCSQPGEGYAFHQEQVAANEPADGAPYCDQPQDGEGYAFTDSTPYEAYNAYNAYQTPYQPNDGSTPYEPAQNMFAFNDEQSYQQAFQQDYGNALQVMHDDPKKKQKKARKPLSRRKATALAVVACMIVSAAAGYGGGVLAMGTGSHANGAAGNSSTGSSIVQTSANQNNTSELSTAEIANLASNSVVEIRTESVETGNRFQQYISEGAGSGVIISADGNIVTNSHVISGATKITVRLKSGDSYEAKLIGTDPQTDVALLKIEATGLQAATFGDSSKMVVGEKAVAIGNPLGELGGTVTDGIISALDREITIDGQTMTLLQTNAAINPGNSGGGLFNAKGELIGVVNAKSGGENIEGLGFAIPSNKVKEVIDQLAANGYVKGRAEAGLTLLDIDTAEKAMMYRVDQLGTYVYEIKSGSGAEQAGFQPGDRLMSADGQTISGAADFKAVIDKHSVGDSIEVTVDRGGQTKTLTLKLGEYNPNTSSNETSSSPTL